MRELTDTISVGDAPPPQGWSRRELLEIGRVRAASERCLLELVSGESDEADPWCVVCDQEGERVLLHIARIDRRYVIARPCRSRRPQRTTSITAATEVALRWLDRELHDHRLLDGARSIRESEALLD
jgi:hypothetical protein